MGYGMPPVHAQTTFLCCTELLDRIRDTICVHKLIGISKEQVSERFNIAYMPILGEFIFHMGKLGG